MDGFLPWSPLSIARETALKRKLLVSGGRPGDRAGGVIALERVLDGKSPYAVPPPEGEVVIIKARKDSSWAPFDVSENVELEEGFEEELEEMNRNDNGFSAASAADNNAASGEDLVDYEQWTGDEDDAAAYDDDDDYSDHDDGTTCLTCERGATLSHNSITTTHLLVL